MTIIRKVKGFLTGFVAGYHPLEKEFIKLNQKQWQISEQNSFKKNGKILVYVRDHFPRRIIEAMLLAKKLEDTQKKEIIVALDGFCATTKNKHDIYASYGVENFYYTYGFNLFKYFSCFWKALMIFCKLKIGSDILSIKYKNQLIGEEIYDTILRWNEQLYTVDKIRWSYVKHIYKMIYFMDRYEIFIKKKNIDTIIFSDLDYVPRNALEKIGIRNKCEFYHSNVGRYKKYENVTTYKLVDHIKLTEKEYQLMIDDFELVEKAERYLNERLNGVARLQADAKAFLQKEMYDRKKLYEKLNKKDNKKKLVCVAAHAFSDRVHYGFDMLYQDYYVWLIETLKILSENHNIDVWVKGHPSFETYHEDGMIEKILDDNFYANIYLIPDNFNTASVKDIFDYIVTCQGTMGLEMACFGIPVFTASKGYYHGYKIDINSESIKEYKSKLSKIEEYPRLNEEQILMAKKILYLQLGMYAERLKIPSVLPKHLFRGEYGYDYEIYWSKSYNQYSEINERMKKHARMKDEYYEKIEDIIV